MLFLSPPPHSTHNEVSHQRQALPVVGVAKAELPVRVEAAGVHVGVRPRDHHRVVLSAPDRLFSPPSVFLWRSGKEKGTRLGAAGVGWDHANSSGSRPAVNRAADDEERVRVRVAAGKTEVNLGHPKHPAGPGRLSLERQMMRQG